ncbi:hypothetical protein FGB62_1g692 [Gracilaria domingensis]|nr:hypothetical protein FGB62_1g692 [Gracilaria domingensis]
MFEGKNPDGCPRRECKFLRATGIDAAAAVYFAGFLRRESAWATFFASPFFERELLQSKDRRECTHPFRCVVSQKRAGSGVYVQKLCRTPKEQRMDELTGHVSRVLVLCERRMPSGQPTERSAPERCNSLSGAASYLEAANAVLCCNCQVTSDSQWHTVMQSDILAAPTRAPVAHVSTRR